MNKEVGALRVRLNLDNAEFGQSLTNVNSKLRGLRSEMNVARSGGAEFGRSLDGLRSRSDILTRTFEAQRIKVNELRRRYEESVKTKGEDATETQRLLGQYNNTVAAMNRTEEQLKAVNQAIKDQINPLKTLETRLKSAGDVMQNTGKKMAEMGKDLTMKVTAPIVGLGAASIKMATDFNKGMANVATLIPGNVRRVNDLKTSVQTMAVDVGKSTADLTDGLYQTVSAFGDTSDTAKILEINAKAAAAGLATTTNAIDLTSAVTKGYGDTSAEAVQHASDLAFTAVRLGQTTFPELASSMGRVIPLAAEMNVAQEELFAVMATGTGVTGTASEVTTQFRSILQSLMAPTGKMTELFEELGYENGNAMYEALGLQGALEAIVKEAEDSGQPLQKYIGSVEGQTLALALSGAQADTFTDKLKEMQNVTGATDQAFQEQTEGINKAGFTWDQFKQRMSVMAQNIGDSLIPSMMSLADTIEPVVMWISDLVTKFAEADPSTQRLVISLAGLAAAAGPILVTLGSLTTTIGGIVSAAGALSGILAGAGGVTAAFTALTGPVGLAVTALGLAAGGIYAYNQHANRTKEVNLDTANSFLDQANSLEEATKNFEDLQRISNLTTEEFGRLLDIQTELDRTQDPEKIAALKEEYEKLREKSGLTNEQLNQMLGLNEQIIDQSPYVERSFTSKGNAIVESTEKNYEYIQSLRDMAWEELKIERMKSLEQEKELRDENNRLNRELSETTEEINRLLEISEMSEEDINKKIDEGLAKKQELLEKGESIAEISDEIAYWEAVRNGAILEGLEGLQEQRKELQEKLTLNEQELDKLTEIDEAIASILLLELGINQQGREGLRIADENLQKLRDEKKEIDDRIKKEGDVNGHLQLRSDELSEQIEKHERIIGQVEKETRLNSGTLHVEKDRVKEQAKMHDRLKEAHTAAGDLTRELDKDVTKRVNVTDGGSVSNLNRRLSAPVYKRVSIQATGTNFRMLQYANGTDYHPGGPAIVGEEGFELARHNNRWSMLDFGIADLPRGAEVFTNNESKRIIEALNSMNHLPAYADGVGANRSFNLDIPSNQRPQIVNYITVEGNIDSELYERINREQQNDVENQMYVMGVK